MMYPWSSIDLPAVRDVLKVHNSCICLEVINTLLEAGASDAGALVAENKMTSNFMYLFQEVRQLSTNS